MPRKRFTIRHADAPRESFGPYQYELHDGLHLIAHYWHDYRGGESGIEFVDGRKVKWPFGEVTEFLTGGGPEPLGLTDIAIEFLEEEMGD